MIRIDNLTKTFGPFTAVNGLSFSVAPGEVLVVGDTLHDLHMGRAAGAGVVVGVLSGTGTRELLAPHCDYVIDDVLALESVLPV